MRFDFLDQISLAGDPASANDDRAGAGDTTAWVFDGATDLGPPGLVGTRGGAAWIAQEGNAAFTASTAQGITAACGGVYAHVAQRFAAIARREPVARWELPIAAFLAVTVVDGGIEIGWAGDCVALLRRGDMVERLGPPGERRDGEAQHARRFVGQGLGIKPVPAPVLDSLRDSRNRRSRPVLSVEPGEIDRLATGFAACGTGDELLLMSDGFFALVDSYAVYDEAALFAAARAKGLARLGIELRGIEADDPACTRYPRFKQSDDATALWLRCVD